MPPRRRKSLTLSAARKSLINRQAHAISQICYLEAKARLTAEALAELAEMQRIADGFR